MRPSLLAWSLFSLFSVSASASPADSVAHESGDAHRLMKRADKADHADSGPTTFNGVEVPPMKVLTQDNFPDAIKDGYWSENTLIPNIAV